MNTPTMSRNVEARIATERRIISRFVKDALAAGYTISVFDGEEYPVKRSIKYGEVMDAIQATDEETLVLRRGEYCGSVLLVYGNDGTDVIADYSSSLEPLMVGANELADRIESTR